jgi:Na+/proline symporter
MTLDWIVIAGFFVGTAIIGLYFSRRATSGMEDYFVAGRKMTWWLAGTSIVATSFAADTPLVIAGWMRTVGLDRNWFWWGGIMGMMLCTFFFARLWRRANILTDVEFNELRYSGKPAITLRVFHASYRSLIQNTLVMGWVTLAMAKILEVTLNIPTMVFMKGELIPVLVSKGVEVGSVVDLTQVAAWPLVGLAVVPAKATGIVLCLAFATAYSALSGLWGVIATDFFQFCLAMIGTFTLMFVCMSAAGGPANMISRAYQAVDSGNVVNAEPVDRQHISKLELEEVLDKDIVGRAETYSAMGGNLGPYEALLQSGLLVPDPEDELLLQWNAAGLTETQVEAGLEAAGFKKTGMLIPLWKKAYTIGKGTLLSYEGVDALRKTGLLRQDLEPDGKPREYFRFEQINFTDNDLQRMLDEEGVQNKSDIMAAWRGHVVVTTKKITSFLPPFDLKGGGLLAIWSIIVFVGLQWWVGGEGGGFLAQRLFSCKNEKHSVLAMLWFNFLNFVVRPWPWIVVGIASLFLIPDITRFGVHFDHEHAYVVMLMKYLPVGLKGLLVASLMAAYMSTISTHVNFGASYVINDLYKRFINPDCDEHRTVRISQITSVVLALLAALYALMSESVAMGWFVMFELMSGVGFVVLLRWYWWRVSAWSELSAMVSSLVLYGLLNGTQLFQGLFHWLGWPTYLLDEYAVRFTMNIAFTTVVWLVVTFLTPPEKDETLVRYYKRIQPPGWWRPIAAKAGRLHHMHVGAIEWACWGLGVTGLFSMIFFLGKLCFGMYLQMIPYLIYSAVATWLIFRMMDKMDWTGVVPAEESENQNNQE